MQTSASGGGEKPELWASVNLNKLQQLVEEAESRANELARLLEVERDRHRTTWETLVRMCHYLSHPHFPVTARVNPTAK